MKRSYSHVISQLKKQADSSAQSLIELLEANSTDENKLHHLLSLYEESLVAADILERQSYDSGTITTPGTTNRRAKAVISRKLKKMEFVPAEKTELQVAVIDTTGKVSHKIIKPVEGQGVIIGRRRKKPIADVGLVVNDDSISSRHCEICWTKHKGWSLVDFGTTNGTLLNGDPVIGEKPLPNFSVIHIGDSVIKVFPKEKEKQFVETMQLYVE
jgi:hypothetical protein